MRRSIRKRLRTSEPTNAPRSSPLGGPLLRPGASGKTQGLLRVLTHRPPQPSYSPPTNQSLETALLEDSAASRRGRRPRRAPRPQRQQILIRRGLALGGGLIVLILLVLGVKGCLDARANRELSDYARNVAQIVEETEQTSKAFFGKLADPGPLSVTEFVTEVSADRSAMDNYAARIDGLSAPGDMSSAQDALELTYELRADAMGEISDKMRTALGDEGAAKATAGIARQMQKLLAAD